MSHTCPHCGGISAWGRFVRFLWGEIELYTRPLVPAPPCFTFVRFQGSNSEMKALYRIGIPKVEDPNNQGYLLVYSVDGQSQPELAVQDGQEILLPANGNLFTGVLVPVGPNGPKSNLASDAVEFTTEVYTDTPPPPPPPPPGDLQRAPTPNFAFQGFRDDDGGVVPVV